MGSLSWTIEHVRDVFPVSQKEGFFPQWDCEQAFMCEKDSMHYAVSESQFQIRIVVFLRTELIFLHWENTRISLIGEQQSKTEASTDDK